MPTVEFCKMFLMFFVYLYMLHSLRNKRPVSAKDFKVQRFPHIHISHVLTFLVSLAFCNLAGRYGWYGLAYNPMLQFVLLALLGLHIWFIHNDYVTMKPLLKRPMRIITASTGVAFLLLLILYFVSCLEGSLPVT